MSYGSFPISYSLCCSFILQFDLAEYIFALQFFVSQIHNDKHFVCACVVLGGLNVHAISDSVALAVLPMQKSTFCNFCGF